jgi:hypothetical protein
MLVPSSEFGIKKSSKRRRFRDARFNGSAAFFRGCLDPIHNDIALIILNTRQEK